MTSYCADDYRPERFRQERVRFSPPLRLIESMRISGISYLPVPRIFGNRIFLVSADGSRLRAVEIPSANILWEYEFRERRKSGSPYRDSVLLDANRVLIMRNEKLFVIDANSGKEISSNKLWLTGLGDAVIKEDCLILGKICEKEKKYIAYDIHTKDIVWAIEILKVSQKISSLGNKVFLVDWGKLSCYDYRTGELYWAFDVKMVDNSLTKINDVPLAFEHTLVVPILDYGVVGLDIKSGVIRWKQGIDRETPIAGTVTGYPDGTIHGMDGHTYVAIDVENGKIISRIVPEKKKYNLWLTNRLCITEDFVYFGDYHSATIACMDRKAGNIIWTYQCPKLIPMESPIVIIDGRMFVAAASGKEYSGELYVFEQQR